MRSRPWILVLALTITFLALLMYHGWSLFRANERIKNYLVSQLQPVLGEQSQIEKLDMALGAVHLKGVHIVTNDNRYSLWIKDLRIGYSIVNLIKNGFKPQKSPHDVLFVQPEFTVHYVHEQKDAEPKPQESTADTSYHDYLDKISRFDFLKRITISRGSIFYADSNDTRTELANDINGWISTKDVPDTKLRLVGKLFDSNQFNTRLNGEIDLIRSKLNFMEVNLINFEWKERVPFFIPEYLNINQGLINGNITLSERENERSFDINGQISINDGAISIENDKFAITDINLEAEIKDWDFVIKRSEQNFNGSPVTIRGSIKNIVKPEFNLVMTSDSFDLRKFQRHVNPTTSVHVYGKSDLSVSLSKSYHRPHIEGAVHSSYVKIDGFALGNLDLQLSLRDSVLTFDRIAGHHKTMKLFGNGRVDFTRPDSLIKLNLSSSGQLPQEYIPNEFASMKQCLCESRLKIAGNPNQLRGTYDITILDQKKQFKPLTFANKLTFNENIMSFTTKYGGEKKIVGGEIALNNKIIDYRLNLFDIHEILYQFQELQAVKKFLDFDFSRFTIAKNRNKTTVNGSYSWKHPYEINRTGEIRIVVNDLKNKKNINLNTTARFGKQSYIGKGNLVKTVESLIINDLSIENIFSLNGKINLVDSSAIECRILFPNSDLNHIYNLMTLDDETLQHGNILGNIDISGTLDEPDIKGRLSLTSASINDVGLYDGYMEFNYLDRVFSLERFNINKNGELLFTFTGDYDQAIDNMNFHLSGNELDLDNILPTVLGTSKILKGQANIDLRVDGSAKKPSVVGKFEVTDGKFSLFNYDSLLIRFNGHEEIDDTNHFALNIPEFVFMRNNDFRMTGSGHIPLNSDTEMNIALNGRGNILSILPDITNFFHETASNSTWKLNFGGTPDAITVEHGEIHIDDGFLQLGAVAPKIKSIHSDIVLESDGFVNVKDLSGVIRGRPFRFKNFRADDVASSIPLVPFEISSIGLNLGVFSVTTSPKGVPLHIPGLMENGEIGYFEFVGRTEREQFYFAGPPRNPVVRGRIKLRNVNLMYPFTSPSPKPQNNKNVVVDVLKSVNWNVKAVPIKDTRYEKEFPSGVDRLYVNLMIDSGSGGLDFSGMIQDSSFRVEGKLESTEGTVDYLDFDFRVERAGVEFDKSTLLPIAYGQAKVAIADSLGVLNHIFLTLLLEDEISGHKQTRGRWGNINFEITTDNPNIGLTDAEILASLGYSGDNIREKATDIIGISTDNLLFRPLFRPFERQLERTLKLDMVRLSSRFTRNLIEMNLWNKDYIIPSSNLYLLKSTRLIVGKYLVDNLFLSYTGQLESGMKYDIHGEELGLKHTLGLEFRINSNLLLEMEYNYNSFLIQREDKRIFLRHSFPLQ